MHDIRLVCMGSSWYKYELSRLQCPDFNSASVTRVFRDSTISSSAINGDWIPRTPSTGREFKKVLAHFGEWCLKPVGTTSCTAFLVCGEQLSLW